MKYPLPQKAICFEIKRFCYQKHIHIQYHYKNFKIQPVEFITSNNLTFLEGNVIKYTTRARYKNGIEDYEKAKHCLELLIEHIKEHGHNE